MKTREELEERIRELEAEVARLTDDETPAADLPTLEAVMVNLPLLQTPFMKLIGGSR